MAQISGRGRFWIISKDSEKLADFRLAADTAGILCKQQSGACQCFGLAAAREKAAALMAVLYFGPWEQRLLANLAKRRYECFSEAELRLLLKKAFHLTQEDGFCWGLFAGEDRRDRLTRTFAAHLSYCPHLNLDGFTRFRMEGYREYLQTLLSLAADEVLSEQEDQEYLRLLQDFITLQPPGEEIHVFLLRQGMYDICVNTAAGLRFIEGGRLSGCEDMLLYTLMQMAPQQLVLHIEQPLPPSLHRLLYELFGQRMRLETLRPSLPLDNQQLR